MNRLNEMALLRRKRNVINDSFREKNTFKFTFFSNTRVKNN